MKTLYWEKGEFKWWILLLAAYHFFPFITTKGSILLYAWAYGIPLLYIACNLNYLKRVFHLVIHTEVFAGVCFLVVLTCMSIFIPVLYGTNDFEYLSGAILTVVKIAIRMLFLIMVIIKNIPKATKETFMKYFIFSCCLYVLGTIVMLLVPPVKDIFYELVKESVHSKTLALETRYSTRYGWAGFSGFEHTFKCVLAVIFNDYLIRKVMKNKKMWLMLGVSIFLLIGTLFYGRVGFLFGIVVMMFFFLRLLSKRPKILLIVLGVCAVGAVTLIIMSNINDSVKAWVNWAFDLFITFVETGKLQTESSNVLLEKMLFVPEIKTILMGDGRYAGDTGAYYMGTDAGVMRPLLFGGILFAFIRYMSMLAVLIPYILKKWSAKAERTLFAWTILLTLVLEIKGEILFSCLPIIIWVIVMDKYEKTEVRKWKET